MSGRKGVAESAFFSFRCIHATRHTPHTCQKSCRKGGADQEGDEGGGTGTEEMMRGRRGGRDGGVGGWRWG